MLRILPQQSLLSRKLVLPLIAMTVVLSAVGVWQSQQFIESKLRAQIQYRAEVLNNAVNYAAEVVDESGELQRIVNALGGEADVKLIMVVSGTPPRVISSTQHILMNRPLNTVSEVPWWREIGEAIRKRENFGKFYSESDDYLHLSPLLLSRQKFEDVSFVNGAVMVRLDTGPMRDQIQRALLQMCLLFFGGMTTLSVLVFILIQIFVLNPVNGFARAVDCRRKGDISIFAPVKSNDEIGQLASGYNDLLTNLSRTESRYQTVVDQVREVIFQTDAQGCWVLLNSAWEEVLQYKVQDCLGQPFEAYVHPDDQANAAVLYQCIQSGQAESRYEEIRLINRFKEVRWVEMFLRASRDDIGLFIGASGTLNDVTERKEVEKSLEEAIARANKMAEEAWMADQAKGQFLAMMSHEIRTPMNGIMGMTQLVLSTKLTPEQKEYIRLIRYSSDNLLNLINDILDFSKIEAGKMDLEEIDFSLRDCIEQALKVLAIKSEEKGLRLQHEIPSRIPDAVLGDPTRLRQVLLNLLNNAIKFSDKGDIRLSVERVSCSSSPDIKLRIMVADSGSGIPESKRDLLFKPFSQTDTSTSRKFGGTGLGLVICKRLVTMMGGDIEVQSEVGEGSLFKFTVNLKPARHQVVRLSEQTGHTRRFLKAQTRAMKVLVAEDHAVNQILARRLLEKRGHQVVVVENGLEVLERLESEKFDLILMDILMPELNGLETTARIRELEQNSSDENYIPIIGLTANAMKGDREECLKAGMDDYMPKPLQAEALYDLMEQYTSDRLETPVVASPPPENDVSETENQTSSDAPESLLQYDITLETMGGDEELARQVVEAFLEHYIGQVEDLQKALDAQDSEVLEREAHKFKGAAKIFVADPLVEAAGRLEIQARESQWDQAELEWSGLKGLLAQLITELEEFAREEAA